MIRVTKKFLSLFDIKQKMSIVGIMILILIGGIVESLSISLVYPVVSVVMDETAWNSKWYTKLLCSIFRIETPVGLIETLILLLIALFVFKNLFLIMEYYIQYTFIGKNKIRIQGKLLDCFLKKPYIFFLHASSGEIMRIINVDTSTTFNLLCMIMNFYTEIIVSVILVITIIIISPSIALVLGITLLMELIFIACLLKPIMRRYGEVDRSEAALTNKWILQALNGIKSLKVERKEKFFKLQYELHVKSQTAISIRRQTVEALPRCIIESFTVIAVLLYLLVCVRAGNTFVSIVPQLSAFVVAAVRLLPSANRLSGIISSAPYSEGALDNVIKNLSMDRKFLDDNGSQNKLTENIFFEKEIKIQNISFSYYPSKKYILRDASMKIMKGESVGIVGKSGAGKTTLVDIILGLLTSQAGTILVDGKDIHSNLNAWLSHLSYIPQQIFLMDDTIRANVAFGLHHSMVSDDKVWDALQRAQLDTFVKMLPEQLDTSIGEAGVRLSGGQRQRLGIARALYSNPELLIFDEATSALDNETELAIMEAIDSLKGKKTMIIIAHRLSTIENCDSVYRVEKGKIRKER